MKLAHRFSSEPLLELRLDYGSPDGRTVAGRCYLAFHSFDLADFSFSTGISQNFQNVIEQVMGEYRRSLADLQSRGQALPTEMQQRIEREQAGRTV